MTPAMIKRFVMRYVRKIIVLTIAILSDSLSHFDAFSPSDFAHHLHHDFSLILNQFDQRLAYPTQKVNPHPYRPLYPEYPQ